MSKNLNLFIQNISDLNEIQRASYYRFLSKGLSEEILNFQNPFFIFKQHLKSKKINNVANIHFNLIYLHLNNLKLIGPNITINTCFNQNLSYTIQIFLKTEFYYSIFNKNLNVNLTNIDFKSLILKKFFKKKIINQIKIKQDIYIGEFPLLTNEGTFIINGFEKIIISQIIRSPGVYFLKNYQNFKTNYISTIISNKNTWTNIILDTTSTNQDCVYIELDQNNKIYLFDLLKVFGLSFEEIIDNISLSKYFLFQIINNSDSFINLTSNIYKNSTKKEPYFNKNFDFYDKTKSFNKLQVKNLEFIKNLIKNINIFSIGEVGRYNLNNKLNINFPKDITNLTSYDFLKIINQLFNLKYLNIANDDIDDIKNKIIRSVGELLQTQFHISSNFFEKEIRSTIFNKLIEQRFINLDTNKLEYTLTNYTITENIQNFFNINELSQFMDQINPLSEITHKRKISLLGPNGLQRGQINLKLRDIHPSQYGKFCTIETPEGENAGLTKILTIFGRINYLNNIETPYFFILNGKILSNKKPIFLNTDQESLFKIAFTDIIKYKDNNLLNNYFSIKTKFNFLLKKLKNIDFVLLSSLQIISLANSVIPFIEHNDTNRALMGSNMQRQTIPLLYSQKAIIGTGFESISILDSNSVIKAYSEGIVIYVSSTCIKIKDYNNQIITYFLKKYQRSNQNTCINQKSIVMIGEKIYSNQIIADTTASNEGELALGKNLLVGYMPWDGYNYEDAIIISEKVIIEDLLTSIYITEFKILLNPEYDLLIKNKNNIKYSYLTEEGIIKIGTYIKPGYILINKITYDDNILNKSFKSLSQLPFEETSIKAEKDMEGYITDIKVIYTQKENTLCYQSIVFYISKIQKLQLGDKLSGRHGNKGIVAKIVSINDMPYLPNGIPLDIILNPLGVPSRMNVGQIFESLLGFAANNLKKRYTILPFDEIYKNDASRILINQKLKEAALKKNINWLFNYNYPGKIFLRDGRTGEFFDNPITVGKSYILKLIHLIENKIHSRSIGPYNIITQQPVAGKSHKGGQRFGEMEIWALEAYGCSYTLQEILTIKSDDIFNRNNLYNSMISKEELSKSFISESFLTLIRELNSLSLDFSLNYITNEFINTENFKTKIIDIFNLLETNLKLNKILFLVKENK